MSTVGTLYDETIKNGFSTLLSTQIINPPTQVLQIIFSVGNEFDTYWWDFSGVRPSAADHLCMRCSLGGADQGAGKWAFYTECIVFGNPDNTMSYYTGALSAAWNDQVFLAPSTQSTHPCSGRLVSVNDCRRSDNWKQFVWQFGAYVAGGEVTRGFLGGGFPNGSQLPLTSIRFYWYSSSVFTHATIRMYGFRMGT